ncbi:MAG: ARMT1-like domain-containing protein [Candidatus Jordarchaeales archaeon]
MKIRPICIVCLISRAYRVVERLTGDEELRMMALREVLEALNREINHGDNPFHLVPAYLGTVRERTLKRVFSVEDPFLNVKRESNTAAMKALPDVLARMNGREGYDRFRQACLVAVAGNMIEFDVLGREFSLNQLYDNLERAEEELVVDDAQSLYDATSGSRILYLTDNAGEIVFDAILVKELKRAGAEVIVAVKERPVMNDATMSDALEVGMDKVADRLITTGTDTVGLFLQECSCEFLEEYESANIIVAKGMGNFEFMTEYEHPCDVYFLLRTKCAPVAECIGVPRERNVILRLPAGRKLKC